MNTIKLTRPASLEMTRPAALALLVIADRGPEFAQGVLWALGLIDLANALAHYRTRMDAAMRDIRASLGQPETPAPYPPPLPPPPPPKPPPPGLVTPGTRGDRRRGHRGRTRGP